MPFALALLASAVLHITALLSPAWELPTSDAEDPTPRLDAVLLPTPPTPPTSPSNPSATLRPHVAPPSAIARAPKPHRARTPSRAQAVPAEAAVSPTPTFDEPAPVEPLPNESAPTPSADSSHEAPPSAVPFTLPKKGRIRFIVTRGENGLIIGQSINTWVHDGTHYTFTNITETTGLAALFKPARVIQESRGEITPAGLRPLSFSNERKDRKDIAQFDWTGHLITYADRTEPVADGTQDMLSMYYQLALQLAMDQPMTAIDLPIATGRKLERYHFELIGEETLTYQGRTHPTQHLRTKNGEDIIDLWISKTVHGLPLKIRFTDRKGGIFDQIADDTGTETTHE